MKTTSIFPTVAGLLAALASPVAAQELSMGQVGTNCARHLLASADTAGDVPISLTNGTKETLLIAWMNFSGNAVVFGMLPPGSTFTDMSHPQHRYVVMDGNLNCLKSVRLGLVGHTEILR